MLRRCSITTRPMDLPTQADFAAAATVATDPVPLPDALHTHPLLPFPSFMPSAVVPLAVALSVTGTSPVLAVVSHVSESVEVNTRAGGGRVLRTTVMLNDTTRRNSPLVVWGDLEAMFGRSGVIVGDVIALSAVVPNEFRGTRQLKCAFHCRGSALYRNGTPLVEPPASPRALGLVADLGRLYEWSLSELSYLWRLPRPSVPAQARSSGQAPVVVSTAAGVLEWGGGADLPALRCRVSSVQESIGSDCLYRVGRHSFRRWHAALIPDASPGVAILCLLWHFVDANSMADSGARATFAHLRAALEAAARTGAVVDITFIRVTHSAVFDCIVLNNTPRSDVLHPPLPPRPLSLPVDVTSASMVPLSAAAFEARRRDRGLIRGRVTAVLWPGVCVRVVGTGAASGELAALTAHGTLPWACVACAASGFAGGVVAGTAPHGRCVHAAGAGGGASSSTYGGDLFPQPGDGSHATTCRHPSSWPLLALTRAGLRCLLHLRCPSCLGRVEEGSGPCGTVRCAPCTNAIEEVGRNGGAEWGRRAAPAPPQWAFERPVLLVRSSSDAALATAATFRTPVAPALLPWWWVRVGDDDLVQHLLGGVSATLAASALAGRAAEQGESSGAPSSDRLLASLVAGLPVPVEHAVVSLVQALCGTEFEADVAVEVQPGLLWPGTAALASKIRLATPAGGETMGDVDGTASGS